MACKRNVGEWQNLHENNNIVIGYLPKHQAQE